MKTYLAGVYVYCIGNNQWRVRVVFDPATLKELDKYDGYPGRYFSVSRCDTVALRRIVVPEPVQPDTLVQATDIRFIKYYNTTKGSDDYLQRIYMEIQQQCGDSNQPYKDLDIDYAKMRMRRLGIMPSLDKPVDELIGKRKK